MGHHKTKNLAKINNFYFSYFTFFSFFFLLYRLASDFGSGSLYHVENSGMKKKERISKRKKNMETASSIFSLLRGKKKPHIIAISDI